MCGAGHGEAAGSISPVHLLSLSHRLLQNCKDDSLNVTVPMRMLEIFSSERTYLPVISDNDYVASLLEQILHYMVQKGKQEIACLLLLYL